MTNVSKLLGDSKMFSTVPRSSIMQVLVLGTLSDKIHDLIMLLSCVYYKQGPGGLNSFSGSKFSSVAAQAVFLYRIKNEAT